MISALKVFIKYYQELNSHILSISELYNNYARKYKYFKFRFKFHDTCLVICKTCNINVYYSNIRINQ